MRKRLTIAVVAACLVLLVSGTACALFTDTATVTVRGTTGTVDIVTRGNVRISDTFQPGDTQYVYLRVHNAGTCPIKITDYRVINPFPSWLGVDIVHTSTLFLKHCEYAYFRLYVYIPVGVTKPQGTGFWFQIEFLAENQTTVHPPVYGY